MTIVDFLLERIAEDEAAATGGYPMAQHLWSGWIPKDGAERMLAVTLGMECPTCHAKAGETCIAMSTPSRAPRPADEQHGQRRDLARAEYRRIYGASQVVTPARVLAECKAKRRIVEWECRYRTTVERRGESWAHRATGPLRALAGVYADHPDYREEWKP